MFFYQLNLITAILRLFESWLQNSDSLVLSDICKSFNIEHSDRLSRGGGVAVCINNTIPNSLTSMCSFTDGTFESLSLNMFPNSSRCSQFASF